MRVVGQQSYGAALYYFTGSKPHNIAVRKLAQQLGLKINEYGVFRGGDRIAGATEESVFASVGLPYIPPELREDRGEIEAARTGRLPRLVELADLRGDLHCHTDATDGRNSLREMAHAAQDRGFEYLAITDHSRRVTVARGLDVKRLLTQLEQIDRLNRELNGRVGVRHVEISLDQVYTNTALSRLRDGLVRYLGESWTADRPSLVAVIRPLKLHPAPIRTRTLPCGSP